MCPLGMVQRFLASWISKIWILPLCRRKIKPPEVGSRTISLIEGLRPFGVVLWAFFKAPRPVARLVPRSRAAWATWVVLAWALVLVGRLVGLEDDFRFWALTRARLDDLVIGLVGLFIIILHQALISGAENTINKTPGIIWTKRFS